jgi:CRP-like cAMP-binding protein
LATAFESYTLQQPSLESIQALTATVVNMTDYKAFQQLKKQSPQLQELDFLLTEYYALWLERKVAELHTLNATQRYALLLEKSPHVVQQVQLTHIASYLNVSLETLSRIRSKI